MKRKRSESNAAVTPEPLKSRDDFTATRLLAQQLEGAQYAVACACGCGEMITLKPMYKSAACRVRAKRARDRA